MSRPTRSLRTHQAQIAAIVQAIAAGQGAEITDILAAVTPGGGKSLLPVIASATLLSAGVIDRICWVVPRDSLRLQAEEAFADPVWRAALGHAVCVRAADNAPDPCRGLQGYITTYQSVAAAPDLHLAEFQRHRTLLVLDEMHHLPALSDMAPDPFADPAADAAAGWSRALLPLLETARLRLLLSGTPQHADGRSILWLPYRSGARPKTREVDLSAPGWAVVGYSRSQALAERAVLPVMFGAVDGEASWLDEARVPVGPHRLFSAWPTETTRPAIFTALRTGFADQLLREAFNATRSLRAKRREGRGVEPGTDTRGHSPRMTGKLRAGAPPARGFFPGLRPSSRDKKPLAAVPHTRPWPHAVEAPSWRPQTGGNTMTDHHHMQTTLFQLGRVVATCGVSAEVAADRQLTCLGKHARGDWGCICAEDQASNVDALADGGRLMSAYPIDADKPSIGYGENTLWIITEADRSVTTLLLPEEY